MNKSVSPIEIKTSKYSGLSKINFTLKNKEGKIIHRNFMHLVVKSEIKIPKTFVSQYLLGNTHHLNGVNFGRIDGLKVNGTGKGFFELKIPVPSNLDLAGNKEAYFIVEGHLSDFMTKTRKKNMMKQESII